MREHVVALVVGVVVVEGGSSNSYRLHRRSQPSQIRGYCCLLLVTTWIGCHLTTVVVYFSWNWVVFFCVILKRIKSIRTFRPIVFSSNFFFPVVVAGAGLVVRVEGLSGDVLLLAEVLRFGRDIELILHLTKWRTGTRLNEAVVRIWGNSCMTLLDIEIF